MWPNGTQLGDLKGDETVLVLLCHEFKHGTEHGLESLIARAAADVPYVEVDSTDLRVAPYVKQNRWFKEFEGTLRSSHPVIIGDQSNCRLDRLP